MRAMTLEQQFWSHVNKGDECWEWTASLSHNGYGQIIKCIDGKKKHLIAHRVSWEIHFGPIPEGMKVLHRCDNRRCINPGHLFLGSCQDNTDDMIKKGITYLTPLED